MNSTYAAIFVCFAGAFCCFIAVIASKNNKKDKGVDTEKDKK